MSLSAYGGPADDQTFGCSRAPRLLRVVQAQSGRWDCLDQPDDEPRPTERIHLYERCADARGMFICPGGYHARATYTHIISPHRRSHLDATVRARGSWRRFVAAYFGHTVNADGERLADIIPLFRA